VRPALGRGRANVRTAPRAGPGAGVQPDGGDAWRRRGARVRLGLPGHPTRPVGKRPRRHAAPQPGVPDERAGCVCRTHPRRVAGRASRQRRSPVAWRDRDLRGLGHAGRPRWPAAKAHAGAAGRTFATAAGVPAHGAAGHRHLRPGGHNVVTAAGKRRAGKLNLDPALVRRARALAARVGRPVVELARTHTTTSVERAVLRLAGVTGADPDGIPWVNRLVDAVVADVGLGSGVALPVWHALAREGLSDVTLLAQK